MDIIIFLVHVIQDEVLNWTGKVPVVVSSKSATNNKVRQGRVEKKYRRSRKDAKEDAKLAENILNNKIVCRSQRQQDELQKFKEGIE